MLRSADKPVATTALATCTALLSSLGALTDSTAYVHISDRRQCCAVCLRGAHCLLINVFRLLLHPQQADLLGASRYREAKVYAGLAAAADAAVAVATNCNDCISLFYLAERLVDQGVYRVRTARSTPLQLPLRLLAR